MKKAALLPYFLLFTAHLLACGYGGPYGPNYTFYHQENLDNSNLAPFLFDAYTSEYYGSEYNQDAEERAQYLKEWQGYFGKTATAADIEGVLYAGEAGLEDIRNLTAKTKFPSVTNSWKKGQKNATFDYLIYAHQCNALLNYADAWELPYFVKEEALNKIADGLVFCNATKDPFLQMRYGFQLVRLAHFLGEHENALLYFDDCVAPLANDSYIYYRALERLAGAQKALKMPEAAYNFSLVFAQLPDRRLICHRSFRFTDDSAWEESLALCKNNEEKANFYALRAMWGNAYVSEEMEHISRLDPNSEFLKLLFTRELAKYENTELPGNNSSDYYKSSNSWNNKPLKKIATNLLATSTKQDKDFWRVALAYLEMIDMNYTTSLDLLAQVPKGSAQYQQAKLLDFVFRLLALDYVGDAEEKAFYAEYQKHDYLREDAEGETPQLWNFLRLTFSRRYKAQGELGKAYACLQKPESIIYNLDIALIENLEGYLNGGDFNVFEKAILKENRYENATSLLIEMRGTYYLKRNQLKKAIAVFDELKELKATGYYKVADMNGSLFTHAGEFYYDSPIDDYGEAWAMDKRFKFLDEVYDKQSLAKMLQTLEAKATKEPKNAAWYYYLLGVAWNNMSPFGWHRNVLYFETGNGSHRMVDCNGTELEKGCGYREVAQFYYYDPNIARDYLSRAKAATKDKELLARITFAAARTEQCEFFSVKSYKNKLEMDDFASEFKMLAAEYMDTEYYAEVISDCGYFRRYQVGERYGNGYW